MPQYPRSAYDLTGGIVYFARMLHKIRLHAAGDLPPDYLENLGGGFDGRMCGYLNVDYEKVRAQTLAGGSDEDILEWCQTQGRRLNAVHILIWNGFATKRGWRDADGATAFLEKCKAASGFPERADILTLFDYYDVDKRGVRDALHTRRSGTGPAPSLSSSTFR